MKNNADEIRRLKERLGQGTLKTVIIPHISADGDAEALVRLCLKCCSKWE